MVNNYKKNINEDLKKQILDVVEQLNITEPSASPAIMNDPRLEDAFKTPECNEQGYALYTIPVIWDDFSYGETPDGVKIISCKSAKIGSNLFSRYLDEPALVWNANSNLYLYVPDSNCNAVAFKGSSWLCAKKLKKEYADVTLEDLYQEWLESLES